MHEEQPKEAFSRLRCVMEDVAKTRVLYNMNKLSYKLENLPWFWRWSDERINKKQATSSASLSSSAGHTKEHQVHTFRACCRLQRWGTREERAREPPLEAIDTTSPGLAGHNINMTVHGTLVAGVDLSILSTCSKSSVMVEQIIALTFVLPLSRQARCQEKRGKNITESTFWHQMLYYM